MDITRWSTLKSDRLYSLQPRMQKLYTVSKNKTRSWLWLRSWAPYCQIQTQIEETGKTTRQLRYDLNQIPYDYTVEVRNRFKGLDLIVTVPDELWTEVHDIVQETGIKTIPMEKKSKKAKWLSGEALQIAVKRREAKSKGEKQKYKHLIAEFQRISRRDKKAFLSNQGKLFQILKDDAVKVLHSICEQIWKTQQMATGMEKVSFHSNPKERQCQRMFKLSHNYTHLTC